MSICADEIYRDTLCSCINTKSQTSYASPICRQLGGEERMRTYIGVGGGLQEVRRLHSGWEYKVTELTVISVPDFYSQTAGQPVHCGYV